jgi:Ni,Fe-hydrogenase III component G
MEIEQGIVDNFMEKFDFAKDKIFVQREKRIHSKPFDKEEFEQLFHYAHDSLGFYKANHVVGTDDGDDLGFIYLLSDENGIILALKEKAPKSDPRIHTMTDTFPSLDLHERELVDLFGAQVEGLADGPNYPLPDGWPKGSYPMRKDWNPAFFNKDTMTYNPPDAAAGQEEDKK